MTLNKWILLATLLSISNQSFAASEADKDEIVVGTANVLSGPRTFSGVRTNMGVDAYFNALNQRGGVNGRKVKVIHEDDKYEPDAAILAFQHLHAKGAFALTGIVGSPTAAKYVPMCMTNKIPAVGFFSGPNFITYPPKQYIFNTRPPYRDEIGQAVNHLWKDQGKRKFAVIYQNDSYGADCLSDARNAVKALDSDIVASGSYTRNQLDVEGAFETVMKERPDVVVCATVYSVSAKILKLAQENNWHPVFLLNTGTALDGLLKNATPKQLEDVVITEVVPLPEESSLPTVTAYKHDLEKSFPGEKPSVVSLAGYIDALVLAEGMKRAGKSLTRETLVAAVEGIHDLDIGMGADMKVNYTPVDHRGLHKIFFVVIRNGVPKQLHTWTDLQSVPRAEAK